jgi:hypothetical protein
MSAAMVVMAALAGFLFSQRGPLLVSNSKEKIPANLDDGRKEMAQVKSPVAEAELLAVKPQSISSAPHLEPAYVSDRKIVGARPEKSTNGPAVNEIAAVQSVAKTPMPRNGKKLVGSPRSDKEDAGSNSANFLVVGASFVRANPSANAKIITTLAPGTPIEVTGPAGEYFRVRALGTDTIRGYVHREDAFFEQKR